MVRWETRGWKGGRGQTFEAAGPEPHVAWAMHPGGERVAFAWADGRARSFEIATGAALGDSVRHERVTALAFDPDGALVTAGGDGTIRFWGRAGAPLLRVGRDPARAVHPDARSRGDCARVVRVDPSGRRVAVVDDAGRLSVWDWSAGGASS